MANGVSGYFDLTGSNGITMRIHYGETYDVTTNQSVVSSTALQVMSSWYYGVTYYLDGTITVDGSTAASMSSSGGTNGVALVALNTWANVGGTLGSVSSIAHNTDGSKSVIIAVSVKGYTTSGSAGSGWTVSGSKTIALTTIPRASTIGATDANIGAVSMIAVSKKSSGYTHSIHYQFGSLSGYITAAGGVSASEVKISDTSIAFTVPTSFYAQIPNAKSGVCALTCKTYSGSTQIGDAQTAAFTAVASGAACAPNVSGTVVDVHERTKALTGDESVLVRYYSTALAAITASAKNSAAIAAKYIGGVDVTADSREIPDVESGNVIFSAMDSRGYSASITVARTLIPYIKLTNNAVVQRTDPTSGNAVLTLSGDYYNGSFGAADNALTASYVVDGGDLVAVVPTVEGSKYTASVDLSGLDYNAEHSVEVTVSDKLATVTKRLTVRRGIPIFDWGEHDFRFNVPVYFLPEQYAESTEHRGCYYRLVGKEMEWFNPPLDLGVEYRTTERWRRSAVYVMAIDVGAMPNAANKSVSFTIPSGTVDRFLSVTGSTSQGDALPYVTTTAGYRLAVAKGASQHQIIITTDADKSAYTAIAVVKYTKT